MFHDVNHNSVEDVGELGLAGRTVYADANGNHRLDAGEVSAVTDADGNFDLPLTAGTYTLREIVPQGWRATAGGQGVEVTVTDGETDVAPIDFGSVERSASRWADRWRHDYHQNVTTDATTAMMA